MEKLFFAESTIDAGGYWFEIPARWTVLASVKTSGRPVEPRPRLLTLSLSEDPLETARHP